MQRKNPPSLFIMLKSAGVFFTYKPMNYNKQYSTPEELVSLLRDRGLIIKNEYPMIDINVMGFPKNWEEEPLWK